MNVMKKILFFIIFTLFFANNIVALDLPLCIDAPVANHNPDNKILLCNSKDKIDSRDLLDKNKQKKFPNILNLVKDEIEDIKIKSKVDKDIEFAIYKNLPCAGSIGKKNFIFFDWEFLRLTFAIRMPWIRALLRLHIVYAVNRIGMNVRNTPEDILSNKAIFNEEILLRTKDLDDYIKFFPEDKNLTQLISCYKYFYDIKFLKPLCDKETGRILRRDKYLAKYISAKEEFAVCDKAHLLAVAAA